MNIAGWLLWSSLVLPWQAASPGEFSEARAEAVTVLVKDLSELAEWCSQFKLIAERDRVWLAVLSFDPDHFDAHRGLGHRRDRDGVWAENEKRLPPKDRNPRMLKEAPKRWEQAVGPYRDQMLRLLERHQEGLTPSKRDEILDQIIVLVPDDPMIRGLRNEVKLEERWVLRETATGKKRRPELKRFVEEGKQKAPEAKNIKPDKHEVGLGVEWTTAMGTPLVRVLTTGDKAEAREAVIAAHAAGDLFHGTFGIKGQYPEDLRLLLLAMPKDKAALLGNHPGIDATHKAFFERLRGAVIPLTGDLCYWSDTPAQRRDGVVRLLLAWFFTQGFGITTQQGWICEGFGLYLTRSLVGTRLTWFALPSQHSTTAEDNALRAKMYDPSTNWMNEANLMLKRERRPKLSAFIHKDVNGLNAEQLLFSYVVAAYLLEGRPEDTPELLRRIGAGEDQKAVFVDVLGMDVEQLDARVTRWLSERR